LVDGVREKRRYNGGAEIARLDIARPDNAAPYQTVLSEH